MIEQDKTHNGGLWVIVTFSAILFPLFRKQSID